MGKREIIRPAVWIGFTAFGVLLAATFLSEISVQLLCVGCVLGCILLLIFKLHRLFPYALILLVTAAFFLGYYALSYQFQVAPYERYANNTLPVQGKILSYPEENSGNFYYKVHISKIENPPVPVDFTIRLSHREMLNANIDDTIQCTVKFYDFDSKSGLSSKSSYLAKNIVLGGYITDGDNIFIQTSQKHSISYYLSYVRIYLEKKLFSVLPLEEASVLSAMLIGMRDSVPDSVNNDYRNAGVSHVLVISGMHMSILVQFLLEGLMRIGVRRKYAVLFTYPAVFLFMAVSGFTASVLRSGIMQLILLTGLLLGRKADSLNSLAIAAFSLLLFNPFAIGDISLLLSFSATLGMITLSPRLIEFCTGKMNSDKLKRSILQLLVPIVSSVSAIMGTLPVQLYVFGTLNLLSIITSLLILYASAWIIRLGLPAIILLAVPSLSPMSSPLIFAAGVLVRYQNFITGWISGIFPRPIYISGAYVKSTVLIIVLFMLLSRWIAGEKPIPLLAYILAFSIFLGTAAVNTWLSYGEINLLILNTRYAQCTAIVQNTTATVISCSGSGFETSEFLRKNNVQTIDWMFVGDEEAEIRCAEELSSSFEVDNHLVPDTVYFPIHNKKKEYHYGTTLQPKHDINVDLTAYGNYIHFNIHGKRIIIDFENACYMQDTADILITDKPNELISGDLTVLYSDDNFADTESILTSGEYLLTSEHESICLSFKPNGSYLVRKG